MKREEKMQVFTDAITRWGKDNFRGFPWRFTRNPYHLLIAELFLHRTQAKQVVRVYGPFLEKYPDIMSLLEADRAEIAEEVRSLGLNWRIELLSDLAIVIVNQFGGRVPNEKNELLSLPGVGDYISSSVRCFAFGYPDAIIDTNVMRVIARVFGIAYRDSLRRNRDFRGLACDLVNKSDPAGYNYAILDFASMICLPGIPRCDACPINAFCDYYRLRPTNYLDEN